MGADAQMKLPKTIDREKLLEAARKIPIDCDFVKRNAVHFPHGYWGNGHEEKCEAFVMGLAIGANVSPPKWGY